MQTVICEPARFSKIIKIILCVLFSIAEMVYSDKKLYMNSKASTVRLTISIPWHV